MFGKGNGKFFLIKYSEISYNYFCEKLASEKKMLYYIL